MIWFDIVTPKAALFFSPIIKKFDSQGERVLITTRKSEGYEEIVELLDMLNIPYEVIGGFGGGTLNGKLHASIERMYQMTKLLDKYNPDIMVSICSVDANRVAYGLGIPIVNFYDIPLSDYKYDFKKALPQARLTLPLSTVALKPFVVPDEIFYRFALEKDQVYTYDFIDPLIWLYDFKPDINYVKDVMKIPLDKPIIVVREEEFKASYVMKKYSLLYDGLLELKDKIDATFVIIPRYEAEPLKELFDFAIILEKKYKIQHLLAYASLFIGGGGTINLEATYFGTPVISTRSFISHYDKYVVDVGLMKWVNDKDSLVNTALKLIGKRFDELAQNVWGSMKVDLDFLTDTILKAKDLKRY
jgi:predicted glycosyltransferase